MTSYALARPVPGPRIVPFGATRLATDVLPNGRPSFRITQRFNDVNPAFPNLGAHRATDLGNFNCGDQVYAVWGGRANTIGPDQYGALGVIIDHGPFETVYWHLNAFSIARGTAIPVARGQQIGIVGKTGLGAVCHLHYEIKVNGAKIDPEPYLLGAPFVLEDDMNIPTGLTPLAQGVVGPGNRLRVDPATTTGSRVIGGDAPAGIGEAKAYFVQVYGSTAGQPYTLGGKAGSEYLWVGVFGQTWFVAAPLVTQIDVTGTGRTLLPPAPAADCSAQEQALAQIRTKLSRAAISAQGAAQAATATVEALRP